MILLITWCIVRYIRRLFETFAVPKELLVTGRHEANPDPDPDPDPDTDTDPDPDH